MDTTQLFEDLSYKKGELWSPLPGWAKFYLRLGETLSHWDIEQKRFTVALAVPIRSYISTLISAGITCGRAIIPCLETDPEYFDFLASLPVGTPLFYRDKDRKQNAKKMEVIGGNGKRYLGIQVDEGVTNTIKYIPPEKIKLVELSDKDHVNLPHQQKGRKFQTSSPLVSAILGEACVTDFILQSRLENVIIGSFNVLKEEIQIELATTQGNNQGLLADLLRVRELNPPGTAYRTSILAAANKKISSLARQASPYIVLFDGPQSFMKWREYWKQHNWVIILDLTDPNFQYAVTQVNQEYLYRSEKQAKQKFPPLPSGIEMTFFASDA